MVAFTRIFSVVVVALPFALSQSLGFDPSKFPDECLQGDACSPFMNALVAKGCISGSCLCTAKIANTIKPCIQCGVDKKPGTFNGSSAANVFSSYIDGCAKFGHTITVAANGTAISHAGHSKTASYAGLVFAGALAIGGIVAV